MRYFARFMAMWMLVLALTPCADGETSEHAHGRHLHGVDAIGAIHHTEHGAMEEHCSPLCHCSCCHTSVVFFHLDLGTTAQEEPQSILVAVEDQFLSAYTPSIWQPPKI